MLKTGEIKKNNVGYHGHENHILDVIIAVIRREHIRCKPVFSCKPCKLQSGATRSISKGHEGIG